MVDKIINKKEFKEIHNQKGQAIFEMILFLPFLIFLYTIFYTVGNSMSASINQQKAVRGYFYNYIKGNSYVNNNEDMLALVDKFNINRVGFFAIGWRDKDKDDKQSFAPCFKFSSLLKNDNSEDCDDSTRQEVGSSRFIRAFTFYGVCGPVYSKAEDALDKPFMEIKPNLQNSPTLCSLSTAPAN